MKLMAKNAEERYQSALGLKFDLEHCLKQWQETGKIEPFELASRDIAGRFLIPEKLYGREQEVKTLLEAFNRVATGNSEMILVAGFSGIGKTAIVNEVHKPIVQQRGYFIKGKFDQFNRNIPFSAFVQAFRSLMGQLLGESDTQLQEWKAQILEAVGNNGQVLIEVVPELESVIGKQPPVRELSGSAAQNRFNLLFEQFIAVFTTQEHPLVMFLDDLQWADSASLNLIKVLMGDRDRGYLLLLGAYRDNEVFPAHPLILTLAELEKQDATISTITLAPLSVHHINQLLAETFSCNVEQAQPLTELVYQKTQGNPFFTTQFLKGLHEDELITFNRNLGYWECDLVKVRDSALTDDVVEFVAGRLQKLPAATQEVLKLAACIGNPFDLETLAVICETHSEEVANELWSALQEGMILPISQAYKFFQGEIDSSPTEIITVDYRFLHDRVQQAAYSLIPNEQKQITHLQVGRLLFHNTPEVRKEEKLFDIVNQLNIGADLMAESAERQNLSELNLKAGKKAKASTAYDAAVNYLTAGISLLPPTSWESHYYLTLDLHISAGEAAFLNGNFSQQQQWAATVMKYAKTLLDRVKIYETNIQAAQAQGQLLEAIAIALEVLKLLGVEFPEQPTHADVERELEVIKSALSQKTEAEIIAEAIATDPEKCAAMRILASVAGSAYGAAFDLMALMGFKLVELSLSYGNTPESALGYAIYGIVLCELVEDIESGYAASQLVLGLLDRLQANTLKAQIFVFAYDLIRHWKVHIRSILPPLQEGYASGLENGDLEWATFSALIYCYHAYFMGRELSNLGKEMAKYSEIIANLKQEVALHYQEISRQAVFNWLGKSDDPCRLVGEAYNEDEMLPLHEEAGDRTAVCFQALNKLILCNYFNNHILAQPTADLAREYLDGATGAIHWPIFHFHDSLTQLARFTNSSPSEQTQILSQVAANQEKLQRWANFGPMNHLHKYHLVIAEHHRVMGEQVEAMKMYDRAITGAKENEYIQEEALANELAAKFYLDWGKEKYAELHMQEAYYCYARWGAKAKTDQLEEKYPQLLSSILQQPRLQLQSGQTATSTLTQTASSSTSAIGFMLDWATAMKVSQSLSKEIHLDKLIASLMKAAMENAGADGGILLLQQLESWHVVARYPQEGADLYSTKTANESALPTSVINKVKHSIEPILINDFSSDIQFAGDPYLLQEQPKSFLCAPILNQGKLIGILYLENHLAVGAFTRDRVELLSMLCSQAAISLENARLYQQSQDYAQKLKGTVQELQQTQQQLQQSFEELKQAQLQLVQSEKMSALGNLVAGIAHEINNPVGFISGNIDPARDYVQELLGLIDLYQQEYPQPSEAIEEELEAIDLEFVRSDLLELISSMRSGTDRIRYISRSLRTFSRTDKEYKVAFDIHQGIDSTLLILKHRLKANEERRGIEIVKEYGELPQVKCFPGQLNQVFMNLMANAIDALDQVNQGRSFGEITNQIKITTSATAQEVTIRITDNGMGMTEEVRERIFEQGFTTKAVGKGTGLGMAIAKSIITQKHAGKITCTSQLGKGTELEICLPLSN